MGLKILVAEDDRHTRRILEHIFTKDPHFASRDVQIFAASDGEEALQIFERERPDLVISDLLMPRLDGFALCRAIRKSPYGRDVPIIVTSAIYKETALLGRMRQELNVEFLAKPFQVRDLVTTVLRLLDKRGRPAEAGSGAEALEPERVIREGSPASGSLSERGLAALVFDALETHATGQLELRRGKIRKTVYFILGSPVAADSNVRGESLAQYLLLKRILDEAQVSRLLAAAQRERQSVLQTLVAMGWLSEDEILRHYTAIAKLRIINALRWSEGTFAFEPGDTFSDRILRCTIDGAKLVLLGLKRVLSAEEVAERLADRRDRVLRLTTRAERFRDVFESVYGRQILDLLAQEHTIEDLLAKGLEPLLLYTHTYALLATDMARFGEVRRAREPVAQVGDPLDLEHIKRASEVQGTSAGPPPHEDVHREIFGEDEISVVASIPETEAEAGAGSEDSQVVEIPISVELEKAGAVEDPRRKVLQAYLGIQEKNFYELLGVSPQASPEEIERAYRRVMAEFDPAKFAHVDLGTDHPKLEEIIARYRQAYNVLSDPELRRDYDRRLSQGPSFRADPLEAELRFREGEQHLKEGRCADAVESFRQAVLVDPDVADYRAYLAWATYCGAQDKAEAASRARAELEQALQLDPESVVAHFFLGRIAAEQGDLEAATVHLERVLDLEPEHGEALRHLRDLLATAGRWEALERVYRRVIQRLESKGSQRAAGLWRDLGRLYLDELASPEKARTCLERALELDPSDPETQALLGKLSREQLSWPALLERLLADWEAKPSDLAPLEELFDKAVSGQHWEEAYILSSALVGLGVGDGPPRSFYRRYRPRFLQRALASVDEESWRQLLHPNDDPAVAQVFVVLEGAESLLGYSVSLPEAGPPVGSQAEAHLLRVWSYLKHLFGMEGAELAVGKTDVAVPRSVFSRQLVVPEQLVANEDHVETAAHVAYGLGLVRPGRSLVAHLSSKQAKDLVTAIMLVLVPKLRVPDPQGTIGALAGRLAGMDEGRKKQLRSAMAALTRQKKTLSISRYYRGVQATCGRMAFLACGDLVPVLRIMTKTAGQTSVVDVVRFGLSEPGLSLRDRLGLSLVV